MVPKNKAWMAIPLCRVISMLVICPTLKINIVKMEQAFQTSYQEGDKVFMFHLSIGKGMRIFKTTHVFFKSALDV
jgi:hypothetical protein